MSASPPSQSAAQGSEVPLLGDDDRRRSHERISHLEGEGVNTTSTETVRALSCESETAPPANRFVWLLTLTAAISGLLFGYDTGIISATLVSLGTSLTHPDPPTTLQKSLITSVTSLAALLTVPATATIADRLGRRRALVATDVLFVVGAAMQACAGSVATLVAGRAVVGAAVGGASCIAPMYIAELAPRHLRGSLVTMNVVSVAAGQAVAYIVGYMLVGRWRVLAALAALPALLQAALTLALPESPRWLVAVAGARFAAETEEILRRTLPRAEDAPAVLAAICREADAQRRARARRSRDAPNAWYARLPWLATLHELVSIPRNREALVIACMLQALQQLCGFNSLMYYSATLFLQLGFKEPTLASLVVAGTNLIGTIAALFLIDRVGRRPMLLASIPGMVGGLLAAAYGFTLVEQKAAAVGILAAVVLYVAAYALGLGNVPWLIQAELFPLSVRALGGSIATATNWAANFVVGLTFLIMISDRDDESSGGGWGIGPSWTFVLYAAVCTLGWLGIWWKVEETKGRSLEDSAAVGRTDNVNDLDSAFEDM